LRRAPAPPNASFPDKSDFLHRGSLADFPVSGYTGGMYKIVGADKKEYGPVSAEQLRGWISQGRANGLTLVSFEGGPWKPLNTFAEFAAILSPPAASGPAYAYPVASSNSMAITGLVFSILGLLCCGYIGAIIGIVFSSLGLSQIKKTPERFTTKKSVAVAGIALGIFDIVFYTVLYMSGALDAIFKTLHR
jgi:hypothetical protein